MKFDRSFAETVASTAPALPMDVSCTATLVLSTGRGSEERLSWRVADGSLSVVEGASSDDGLVLTVAPKDAEAILSGELSLPIAYMQGRLKPAGDNELWLRIAKAAADELFVRWRGAVASV